MKKRTSNEPDRTSREPERSKKARKAIDSIESKYMSRMLIILANNYQHTGDIEINKMFKFKHIYYY